MISSMPLQILFWGVYLASLAYSVYLNYRSAPSLISNLAFYILVGILGYKVMGSAVHS